MSSESSSSSDEDEELSWDETLQRIKENDPRVKSIVSRRDDIQNLTDEECDDLGSDIANNTHLTEVDLSYADEALNDHRISLFFQGLIRSSSIIELNLEESGFGVAGVQSMVPFLQNANSLTRLGIDGSNIQSEGFNLMFRALRDSPIEELSCCNCGIDSIEIDTKQIPTHLKWLRLGNNGINADDCRELVKLLQRGDATLNLLALGNNKIDDEGVAILVGALINNTSLTSLYVNGNDGISRHGNIMLLELVNDISSIEATLLSNHTLEWIYVTLDEVESLNAVVEIQQQIHKATRINANFPNEERAAAKVIRTQLHSRRRAELAVLQGVNHSVYSEIDPLHLPEVLALIGHHHGQGELYIALTYAIADLISTVNRKECIRKQMTYYAARLKELGEELAAIEAAEGGAASVGSEPRSIKRRRAC